MPVIIMRFATVLALEKKLFREISWGHTRPTCLQWTVHVPTAIGLTFTIVFPDFP